MNDDLKDVIKKVISDIEKKEEKGTDFLKTWEKTVGEKAARHTRPVFIKRKRLVVNVNDSSWLYKLTLDKQALIERYNKHQKDRKQKIKELQFRVGEV